MNELSLLRRIRQVELISLFLLLLNTELRYKGQAKVIDELLENIWTR